MESAAKSWGTRIFLALICLSTLPYAVQCLLDPAAVKDMAAVAATTPAGSVELRAMYGGMQGALALLAGVAVFRPTLQPAALLMLFVFLGGTVLGRIYGVVHDGIMSDYLRIALIYELVATAIAAWLLFRMRGKPVA